MLPNVLDELGANRATCHRSPRQVSRLRRLILNRSRNSSQLAGDDFHFVLSQTPNDTKDRLSRRLAKSHAVKKALEKKRLKSKNDFRVSTVKDVQGRGLANSQRLDFDPCIKLLNGPSPGTLDPFKSVPVDSVRLQILLHNCK